MTDLVTVLRDATAPGLQLRTGRVTYLDASRITVQVAGGDAVDMAAPRGNLIVLGDYVQVLGQGGVWWCLGTPDGIAKDGVLVNPSFEVDTVGTLTPTSWSIYHDPGFASAAVAVSFPARYAVDGSNVLTVTDGGTAGSNTYVASEAVPVQPGQIWTAAAFAASVITGTLTGTFCELVLSYHVHQGDVYPTAAGTTILDSWTVPLGGSGWGLLRQHTRASGVAIPDGLGAVWMRANLHTKITGPGRVDWDCVILRRLDG